jgi:hypothetical protein
LPMPTAWLPWPGKTKAAAIAEFLSQNRAEWPQYRGDCQVNGRSSGKEPQVT